MELSVGDWVLLSTQNLKMQAYTCRKFMPCWLGPFLVREWNIISYYLQLPALLKFQLVFHLTLMKKWHGPPPSEEVPDVIEGEHEYVVEKVLKKRMVRGQQ